MDQESVRTRLSRIEAVSEEAYATLDDLNNDIASNLAERPQTDLNLARRNAMTVPKAQTSRTPPPPPKNTPMPPQTKKPTANKQKPPMPPHTKSRA